MSSDHTPLTVNILIIKEYIQTRKQKIIKNSKEKTRFIDEIIELVKGLNMNYIRSKKDLKKLVQEFAHNTDEIWFKHSKMVNITRYSKL